MISNRWKILAAALPIIGTLAMAQPQPGGLGGFYSQWLGKTKVLAAFSPDSIADLAGWWDASDAETISLVAGTNRVSEWRDKSGLDRHFTQGTAAARPYYDVVQNGLNAISTKGAETMSYNTADQTVWKFLYTNEASVFVAFKISDVASNTNTLGSVLASGGAGGNSRGFNLEYEDRIIASASKRIRMFGGRRGGPNYRFEEDNYFALGAAEIIAPIIDATNATAASRLFVYDESNTRVNPDNTLTAVDAVDASADLFFGSIAGSGFFLSMEIYELIIYSKQVTEAERDDLITYLSNKWGIP